MPDIFGLLFMYKLNPLITGSGLTTGFSAKVVARE
jgi:hypothetical protein